MATGIRKVRGRPFLRGNPGRPPGSKNKITQMVEQLAECQAEQLIQKVLELASAGDVACLRMVFDRLWPPRKGHPVNIAMPPINTSQDVFPAIASIWTAIREGRLTPDEASALSVVIDRSIQAIGFTTSPSASPLSKKPKPDDMRKTILRRLNALETANRAREEKVLSSIRGARVYICTLSLRTI